MGTLNLRKAPPEVFAPVGFAVTIDGRELFQVGLKRTCLMSNNVYVSLLPLKDVHTLSHNDVRILRSILRQELSDARLYCEVCIYSKRDVKFARLFGFKSYDTVADRLLMEFYP